VCTTTNCKRTKDSIPHCKLLFGTLYYTPRLSASEYVKNRNTWFCSGVGEVQSLISTQGTVWGEAMWSDVCHGSVTWGQIRVTHLPWEKCSLQQIQLHPAAFCWTCGRLSKESARLPALPHSPPAQKTPCKQSQGKESLR
jgi:hypothetical protein